MEITTLDNIEFKGKTFVFDSSIAAFHCGGKWITDEEYVDLGWPHYDVYLSEYDKDNPIVKKVIDAGGFVRRNISGKTDYYVVGKSQDYSPAKNRDFEGQLSKGKQIIAITVENLKELLGISTIDPENEHRLEDKFGMIEYYEPEGDTESVITCNDNNVEEISISGDECNEWEYKPVANKKFVYLIDYLGSAKTIVLPVYIDGKRVQLTWVGANEGCHFEKSKAKKVLVPGAYKEIPPNFFMENESVNEIVVGNGIEKIGFDFCAGDKNLDKISFPNTIKSVGFDCLAGTKWESRQGPEAVAGPVLVHKYSTSQWTSDDYTYYVPAGVSCITENAFYSGNDNEKPFYINRVELPASMKYLSKQAFSFLEIDSMKVPTTIDSIGERAFLGTRIEHLYRDIKHESMLIIGDILCEIFAENCGSELRIPEGVRKISDQAMQGNAVRPEHVIFPESLEELGERILCGEDLKIVDFNNNLKKIGAYCFYGCKGLSEVHLPNSIEEMGEYIFTKSGLTSIVIPGGVKNIQYYSFGSCEHLKKVIVTDGVKNIEESAFEDCSSLEYVELPDTLESIGYRAFARCESLKSIKIPASVKEIDTEAFTECGEIEILANHGSYAESMIDKLVISPKGKKIINIAIMTQH